ncbi:MAG: AAA family ATPase [Chloroflexi bacterium]|nr:AAA family ATPase [Chloroflexota bacterium]
MELNVSENLNEKQKLAVKHTEGPLLIIAGPGSGKTRVITQRIAHLIEHCDVKPWQIVAMTFTNKAAREMKDRLETLFSGEEQHRINASTFHSFCAMLLRREAEFLSLNQDYSILDDTDQISLLKRVMDEVGIDPNQWKVRSIQSAISNAKSKLMTASAFRAGKNSYFEEIVDRVFTRYEELVSQSNAVDFDDLIMNTNILFQNHPEVLEKYQSRYLHVMVDEFQDTNLAQYQIAQQLAGLHKNLCVVGDPDQSIYSWRNADITNILSFKKDYPDATEISLEQNYRSTKTILAAAQKVISPNQNRVDKDLWTQNDEGSPIIIAEAYDEFEEARITLNEIQNLIDAGICKPDEIAIMFRVNAQSRVLEEACLKSGVSYQLIGGIRFYQRQEVKDIVSYLRLLNNFNDDASLARIINIPQRSIGKTTLSKLSEQATAGGCSLWDQIELVVNQTNGDKSTSFLNKRSLNSVQVFYSLMKEIYDESKDLDLQSKMDLVIERTGYRNYLQNMEHGEERIQNLNELRESSADFSSIEDEEGLDPLTIFLERVSLISDVDHLDDHVNSITMITLHQAKGLEYKAVFIVGMEEGLLPHSRSLEHPEQMEEERRLCYVGLTRAHSRLYLMRAFRRGFRGNYEPSVPSRFLMDIPSKLTLNKGGNITQRDSKILKKTVSAQKSIFATETKSPYEEYKERIRQKKINSSKKQNDYNAGDKVVHDVFGEGVVVDVKAIPSDFELTIAFKDGLGIKKLLLQLAPIKKLNNK